MIIREISPPVLEWFELDAHRKIAVVRDDLLVGGTKQAALMDILPRLPGEEFVYASPRHGYAQIALAATCQVLGRRATIYVPDSSPLHDRTLAAQSMGARIVQVPFGRLNVLIFHARQHVINTGATLLPFGLDTEDMVQAIARRASMLAISPAQVWSVAGSGTLQRGLQVAWPLAEFCAVRIGKEPRAGRATIFTAPEKYVQPARQLPPFPSCDNYDAKAWQFMVRHAIDGAVFWNVAA